MQLTPHPSYGIQHHRTPEGVHLGQGPSQNYAYKTPTLTGMQKKQGVSVWERFRREGALEATSVSRSEAADLDNRCRWLEQRLADSERDLQEAVAECQEFQARERDIEFELGKAEEHVRRERAKLQQAAQEARIKAELLEKEKELWMNEKFNAREQNQQFVEESEKMSEENRQLKDQIAQLEAKNTNLQEQLGTNMRQFNFDVQKLKMKEKELKNVERILEAKEDDLKDLEVDIAEKGDSLKQLEKELSNTWSKINNKKKDLDSQSAKVEAKEKEIAQLEMKLQHLMQEQQQKTEKLEKLESQYRETSTAYHHQAPMVVQMPPEQAPVEAPAAQIAEEPRSDTADADIPTTTYTREEIMAMTVSALRAALESANLSKKGVKKDLQKRALESHLFSGSSAEEADDAPAPVVTGDDNDIASAAAQAPPAASQFISVDKLESMTVKELKAFLTGIGAPTAGRKSSLIERVVEYMKQSSSATGAAKKAQTKQKEDPKTSKPKAKASSSPTRAEKKKRKAAAPAVEAKMSPPKRRSTRRGKAYILDRLK